MCGKTFRFMELKFLEKALIQGTFTYVSLHSKLVPMSLLLHSRQKEITHFPRQNSFENLFPQQRREQIFKRVLAGEMSNFLRGVWEKL